MELLSGIKPKNACSCCGLENSHLPMDYLIAVGFGSACLTKNDEFIMSVMDAEQMAIMDPEAGWRIHLIGPLSGTHFQRQGLKLWVLYEQGQGFA